jgi:hypothetical protein
MEVDQALMISAHWKAPVEAVCEIFWPIIGTLLRPGWPPM